MMKNKNLTMSNRRNVNVNINKNVNEVAECVTMSFARYEKMCNNLEGEIEYNDRLNKENEKLNKRENLLLNRINELIDFSIEKTLDDINWAISNIKNTSIEELLDENGYFKPYYDCIKKAKIDIDRFKMAIQDRRNEYIEKLDNINNKEVE